MGGIDLDHLAAEVGNATVIILGRQVFLELLEEARDAAALERALWRYGKHDSHRCAMEEGCLCGLSDILGPVR
jgi:hypothetical protein